MDRDILGVVVNGCWENVYYFGNESDGGNTKNDGVKYYIVNCNGSADGRDVSDVGKESS